MSILVINAGSSSLKFGLFDAQAREELANGLIDWTADRHHAELLIRLHQGEPLRSREPITEHGAAVRHAVQRLAEMAKENTNHGADAITAVGHRVVHGGVRFHAPVRIDEQVKSAITDLAELAPLHNPPALQGIAAAESALPGTPQFAVFDTAFFASLTPRAYLYPLPYAWFTDWGIRRFGFHGISHAYCAGRAAELIGRAAADLRLVICHMGNGCSASAVQSGKAVQTTMGFTPMEGLMMGTRSGSIDPGVMIDVQRRCGVRVEQLDHILNHESGLLGVSGVSGDYRQVEAAAEQGNERARLGLEMYADRVRAAIGALTVTLGGIDGLVFTAGIGEHAAGFRASVCRGLECLGVRLDPHRNHEAKADADIAAPNAASRILVLRTREELMIAREVERIA